jgi:phosphohistidine phosphatase
VLIRHAQAADAPVDADRPLTERGARRAAAIGAWLARAELVPDRVVVSPARRAEETWEQARSAMPAAAPPVVDGRIHDNTVEALLAVVRDSPEDVHTVAVVGHNPSVGELAGTLDGGRGDLADGFPTGGVAVFLLPTPFAAVDRGTATLDAFAVPGD